MSYQDKIVRFKLIQGLSDHEIKDSVLSGKDKTLDETVSMIEAKESGKTATKTVLALTNIAKVQAIGNRPIKRLCWFSDRRHHKPRQCSAYRQTMHKV